METKGFCFYKATNGIKRHLAGDTLGFPFFTHCMKANISDDAGLVEMLSQNIEYFKLKPVTLPKITILEVLGNKKQERQCCLMVNLLKQPLGRNSTTRLLSTLSGH